MKPAANTRLSQQYSLGFLAMSLLLLLSFLPIPDLSPSALSTNFRFRKDLIGFFSTFRFRVGDRVFNNAVVGRDGWIFYTGEISIIDYQRTDLLKKRELIALLHGIDKLNTDLAEQGKTLLVVIPPNKSTIYSQYMPEQIPVLGTTSRLDQFISYMRASGHTSIIDLRPALLEAAVSRQVYYKTDTHWNVLGAYYGYIEIIKALSHDYPALKPRPLSDFQYEYAGKSTHDLPPIMGIPQLDEDNWILVSTAASQNRVTSIPLSVDPSIEFTGTPNANLPKLLIYCDSFYGSLSEFFEPHFSKVTAVPYLKGSLEWIRRESPDIVIIEVAERYLDLIQPFLESSR